MPKGIPNKRQRSPAGTVERIANEVARQRALGMKWSDISKHHGVHFTTAMKALKLARAPEPTPATQAPTSPPPTPTARPAHAGRNEVIVRISSALDEQGNNRPIEVVRNAISTEEREAIIKAARVLKKHGVQVSVLTDVSLD